MRCLRIAIALLLLISGAAFAQAPQGTPAFRMIVHPSNPVSRVNIEFLADAFLKRRTQWGNGESIRPVDLDRDSSVRRRFTDVVLKRSVPAVTAYWQQVLFSGRGLPPVELDTEDEVIRYVLRHRGAIGYVSGAADVRGAKIVPIQ